MRLALALMMLNPTTNQAELPKQPKSQWITIDATAYTAFCEPVEIDGVQYKGCTGITATGYDVRNTIYYKGLRVVAVDPDVIPLHSKLEIDTGNRLIEAIALDTGGAIKGKRIDILMKNKEEAYWWGHRDVKVRIKEGE